MTAPGELTARQIDILKLTADGLPMKQIAARLGITVKTVEAHRRKLRQRLGVSTIAGLVRYAIRAGVVPP